MAWLLVKLVYGHLCDAECGRMATDRAHLDPKSRGGDDKGNVALLCRECHTAQEKRTEYFEKERGVDLRAKAKVHLTEYQQETNRYAF